VLCPDACRQRNYPPTDLFNLFKPAYDSGARVHSNSWGLGPGPYNTNSRAIDAFVFSNPTFLVLVASGNDGVQRALSTVGSTAACKNCLVFGATQQSEVLFRSMSPFVDNGQFCSALGPESKVLDPCCGDSLSCVDSCCHATFLLNTSFPCCANQTTCGNDINCSVESGNLRSARNVAAFSSRGPTSDGRFKPDLVAPGEDILRAASPVQTTPGGFQPTSANHCDVPSNQQRRSPQADFNRALQILRGTSMATPLVAGAAEKIRQYFMQGYYPKGLRQSGVSFEPAEALVRAVLLASCVSVFSDQKSWGVWSHDYPFVPGFFRFPLPSEFAPNFFQGFGLPVLDQVFPPTQPCPAPLFQSLTMLSTRQFT
jgi:subtilisin family serine protease